MIAFAMETPTLLYNSLSSWSDFDFVLAHNVLDDAAYALRLNNRQRDRMLIMDNSMHELGEALPIEKLISAAKACRANYVIPPDKLDAPAWNVQQFARARRQMRDVNVAAVMCGDDRLDRLFALEYYDDRASMILLPYRKPRMKWFLEHREDLIAFGRIHLLGVNMLDELDMFATIAATTPGVEWTVDTAKPLKWAVEGKSLRGLDSVRGAKLSSKELLELKSLPQDVKDLAYANVLYLKSICEGKGL